MSPSLTPIKALVRHGKVWELRRKLQAHWSWDHRALILPAPCATNFRRASCS